MELSGFWFAFSLTLFAGLATGIGSLLALLTRKTSRKFLSAALGFSAGIMLYISFVEMLPQGRESLILALGKTSGSWLAVLAFFIGIMFIAIIDRLIPSHGNPHEPHSVEEMDGHSEEHKSNLMRVGMLTAFAIAIHNFPEGIATFIAALNDPSIGIAIAIAVAIHNIPEGIAVSVPVFYATGSRKKAFELSFLSGLAEPAGALAAYFLLLNFINDAVFGFVLAAVAGTMVFISLDELLPTAREYGEDHIAIYGVVLGMAVMAVSLLLL